MKPLNKLYYLLTGLFALFCTIAFWVIVWDLDNWYPIVGAFVASHGALFGTIAHYAITLKANRKDN